MTLISPRTVVLENSVPSFGSPVGAQGSPRLLARHRGLFVVRVFIAGESALPRLSGVAVPASCLAFAFSASLNCLPNAISRLVCSCRLCRPYYLRDSMRKIRSWLDHNKIQPVTFKIISAGVGRLNLNLISAPKIKPSYSSENLTNHQVPDY